MVLEGGPAQPVPFPAAAGRCHAQYEIRVYAEAIGRLVADWVPLAWAPSRITGWAGATLSAQGLDCLRRMLAGEAVTQETSGMSKGEWREFTALIGR
jgi:thymidylate synthase (FAD)